MNFTKKNYLFLLLFVSTVSFAQTTANSNKVKSTTTASEFVKSPYLLYTGKNTEMLVIWQTATSNSCRIDWGTDLTYSGGTQATTEYGTAHLHKIILTGLIPGTTYFYKVTINNTESKIGNFISGASDTETAVSFYAYGDTRTYPADHDAVAKKIMDEVSLHPKSQTFIITSGDLVQFGDQESSWTNEFFDTQYTNIQSMISHLPYLASREITKGKDCCLESIFRTPNMPQVVTTIRSIMDPFILLFSTNTAPILLVVHNIFGWKMTWQKALKHGKLFWIMNLVGQLFQCRAGM